MTKIRSKLPETGTTIFSVMSQLAAEHKALNLSQGFPDFPVDPQLIELIHQAMQDGYNQYAPMPGLLALREAIAQKIVKTYGRSYDPNTEITVTAGATQGLHAAITALVHPGDEVIIFVPAYDSYKPAVELNGGKVVEIPLEAPDFKPDWDRVRDAVSEKTRMILINTPHNPTGTIWGKSDMLELEKLTVDTDIIVLSDEVYEHIIFDGNEHWSVARFDSLAERSITVSSFGKTFHATGWKVGYLCAPAHLMSEIRKVHQYVVFSVNTSVQMALSQYLQKDSNWTDLPDFYQKKRDTFLSGLADSKFTPLACSGTYFQLCDYSQISDEPELEFAKRLTAEHGIAAIPISVFYPEIKNQNLLRFCFAKNDRTLEEAAIALNKI